jgi:hypothetical protein
MDADTIPRFLDAEAELQAIVLVADAATVRARLLEVLASTWTSNGNLLARAMTETRDWARAAVQAVEVRDAEIFRLQDVIADLQGTPRPSRGG